MLGRLLVCAVAMGSAQFALGGPAYAADDAQPAATRERPSYTPDTLSLLLLDQRTTWGTPAPIVELAPGFDMAEPITVTAVPHMPADLASFEALDGAAAAYPYLPAPEAGFATQLFVPATYRVTPGIRLTARDRAEPMGGATGALSTANAIARPYRPRRSPLDTMLVLRIDGEASSPPLSFGGGVASVLNILPRQ